MSELPGFVPRPIAFVDELVFVYVLVLDDHARLVHLESQLLTSAVQLLQGFLHTLVTKNSGCLSTDRLLYVMHSILLVVHDLF